MNEAELIAAVQRARVAMTAQYATLHYAIGTDMQDHETRAYVATVWAYDRAVTRLRSAIGQDAMMVQVQQMAA